MKHRNPMGGMWTITASQPFPPAEITRILLTVTDAFGMLKDGTADDDHFDRIAAVLNVGMVRSEAIGKEGVDVFRAAQVALMECDDFRARHGRYGFTGPGLVAMRDAIELYEQILRASTPLQMHKAQEECMHRLRRGQVEIPTNDTRAQRGP